MATRWGFAGTGKITHDFATALETLPSAEHEIVAVAARDVSRAKEFATLHRIRNAYGSYQELADDREVEIVHIGVLNPFHHQVSKMMLNAGKHVLCEKPLTMSAKDTKELVALAKSKGLFLMEAIWTRCFPIYDALKQDIESGAIGQVKQVMVSLGAKLPHVPRLNVKELGGGTVLDLGIYLIQFATYVFDGARPKSIKATGHLNDDGVDVAMSATLTYDDGRIATITSDSRVLLPNEGYAIGTEGTIKVPGFWCPTSIERPSGRMDIVLPKVKHELNFLNSEGLSFEAAEVRKCLLKGLKESPKVPLSQSVMMAEIMEEILNQIGVKY